MNTVKNTILASAASTLLLSCQDDFLHRPPLDSLTDETTFIEEGSAKGACNGCYGFIGKSVTLDMEYLSDNNLYYDNNQYYEYISAGFHDSYNGNVYNLWANGYGALFRCNKFLENYERGTYSPTLKARMAAEVRFLRAYYFGQMITLYGDMQFITKTLKPDDPEVYGSRDDRNTILQFVFDELDDVAGILPVSYNTDDRGRATCGAAMAYKARIALYFGKYDIAEQAAKKVMDLNYHTLYNIGNTNLNYYMLFRHSGKPSTNTANKEDIFYLPFLEGKIHHNLSRELQLPTTRLDENIRWSPTKSLVDSYLCDDGMPISVSPRYLGAKTADPGTKTYTDYFRNRDPRMYQTILTPYQVIDDQIVGLGGEAGDLGCWLKGGNHFSEPTFPMNTGSVTQVLSRTGFYFTKYCEIGGKPNGSMGISENISYYNYDWNDIRILRYAEVLLTWAEARHEQGTLTQADIDVSINLLRDRVGMHHMIISQIQGWGLDLRDEIRRERRVELALDGTRYFDILRWKQGHLLAADKKGINKKLIDKFADTDQKNRVSNITTDADGNLILFKDRSFVDPRNYLWPVPQTDRDKNKNLGQNPGWVN